MYSPDIPDVSREGVGVLLGVCPFELLRHCGLCAAGQLIVCSRLWAPLQEFLPKVAEASQKGLLLARADCSQLLRCEALGEWHEEELPQVADPRFWGIAWLLPRHSTSKKGPGDSCRP